MKNIILVAALLLTIPVVIHAADKDFKKLFNKYESVSGFELSKEDANIDLDFDGEWGFGDFLDEVKIFYILTFDTENGSISKKNAFRDKLNNLMDQKGFDALIDIDGDGTVKILSRKDSDGKTTDYIVITEGDDEAIYMWASVE